MAHAKRNVRCTSIRKETERKTENQVKRDLESVGLKEEEDVLDRTNWKNHSHNHSDDNRCLEKPEEKKVHSIRTNVDK